MSRDRDRDQPAAGGCGEPISGAPRPPGPVDIRAGSAVEFAPKVDQALGAGGHTRVSIDLTAAKEGGP